jgi:hypothetical protein
MDNPKTSIVENMKCDIDSSSQYLSDACIIVGVIILSITISTSNTFNGLNGYIIGYVFLAAGFLVKSGMLMILLLKKCVKEDVLFYFLTSVLPFTLICIIIAYMIYILTYYFNRIVSGKVSRYFTLFSKTFIVVLIGILFIFYSGTQDEKFKKEHKLPPVYGMLVYLFCLLELITCITINIIIAYYSTDG